MEWSNIQKEGRSKLYRGQTETNLAEVQEMEDELIEKVNFQLKFLISKQINRKVVKH